MTTPTFVPGTNVALKLPRATYDATVEFYRDTLGLPVEPVEVGAVPTISQSHTVAFGPVTLWLDRVDSITQPDVWFEVMTDDLSTAIRQVTAGGGVVCDEVESLEATGIDGHWVRAPAGTIHLIAQRAAATEA